MSTTLQRLTAWSASRYNTYTQCPAKARYQYIDKIPTQQSEAMARGEQIHKIAETYILEGTGSPAPELAKHAAIFETLRAMCDATPEYLYVENQWAFDADWRVTDWFGRDARCRIKVDAAVLTDDGGKPMLDIFDWKTGKYRADDNHAYLEQIELYALASLLYLRHLHPHGLRVRSRLVYLDAGVMFPENPKIHGVTDIPALRAGWERRIAPMLSDTTFAPRQNKFCGWCDFRAGAGGPCKYG
jgi:RecB family exonuclease